MDRPAEARIAITVNGERSDVAPGTTVLDVARACGLRDDERGVAIALGGAVVPRSTWAATTAPFSGSRPMDSATSGFSSPSATPTRPRVTRPPFLSCSATFCASSMGMANEMPM